MFHTFVSPKFNKDIIIIMKQPNISQEQLDQLRGALPRRSNVKIAERAGYSESYVCSLLNGTRELNDDNMIVIEIAQEIAESSLKAKASRAKKLNKFLSDSRA